MASIMVMEWSIMQVGIAMTGTIDVDGKRHGHGVYYYADGSHDEGEWLEGVEVTALECVTHSSEHHQTSNSTFETHSSEPHQTSDSTFENFLQCQCDNFCSMS